MQNELIDISLKPIQIFLDAVDIVLNSNTFLLQFDLNTESTTENILNFINSQSFKNQIIHQDKERKWFNIHYFDYKTELYKIKSGSILKEEFELTIIEIVDKKSDYLAAFLTADATKGRFRSFYDEQINIENATEIVNNFVSFLSPKNYWKLFFVAPNFLKQTNEKYSKNENLRYFEGINGNDTATIILCKNTGFLLLTNGCS